MPAPLGRAFRSHQVVRTGQLGWQSLENGALLDQAEAQGFDVLVTCDQNVPHQQNLAERKLAMVVLSTNHWPALRPVAARIAITVDFIQRGQVIRIDVAGLDPEGTS